MSEIEEVNSDALKNNEYYNRSLEKTKTRIKEKVFAMSTKDEQIKYVEEEITRVKLLKETQNIHITIAIIVAVCGLISFILLNLLRSSLVFFVLWLVALTVLIGAVASIILLSVNEKNIKCTITLMAYEEIKSKLESGAEAVEVKASPLEKKIDLLKESVDMVEDQLRMIYALQRESAKKK